MPLYHELGIADLLTFHNFFTLIFCNPTEKLIKFIDNDILNLSYVNKVIFL